MPHGAWRRQDYRRVVHADEHDGVLTVGFADGIRTTLPIASLLRAGEQYRGAVEPRHTSHEIMLDTASGEIAVPWDEIHVLTDAEFSQHAAREAEARARRRGARLRALRQERSLTARDLARR